MPNTDRDKWVGITKAEPGFRGMVTEIYTKSGRLLGLVILDVSEAFKNRPVKWCIQEDFRGECEYTPVAWLR